MEKKYCLIGKSLKHSFSPQIHAYLGDYDYSLVEVAKENLQSFVEDKEYAGYNVTIPYKKDIIEYLDDVQDVAKEIGAVNTVVNKNGKLIGYNTDFYGIVYSLERAGISLTNKKVMILGSGGTSGTATVVAKHGEAREIVIVSRSGENNYQNYHLHKDTEVIINTTPVGTYPNNYESLVDLDKFEHLEGVLDVIYNPMLTKLLVQAKKKGIKYSNGLPMLVAQAKQSAAYYFDKPIDDEKIEIAINSFERKNQNVVLIGMSGCGKTTIGKLVAEKLNREFIDTDLEIVKKDGRDIPTIFKESGEEYFRDLERQVLSEVGVLSSKVIATGGGIVENGENYFPLKQNGKIFYLQRQIQDLDRSGRPLVSSVTAVKKLFERRRQKYLDFADVLIDNNKELQNTVGEIIKHYEDFSD
ncbi:MAG: AAA family ATPase [Clostridia bacterium]|nr:AAA family ATPase [Clostridia bacterium]